jgi:hypothetical protein
MLFREKFHVLMGRAPDIHCLNYMFQQLRRIYPNTEILTLDSQIIDHEQIGFGTILWDQPQFT